MKVIKPDMIPFSTVQHTRNSSATYIDDGGFFVEVGANQLRITYDKDTHRFAGILIEPRRTNLFRNTGTASSPSGLSTQTINIPSEYFTANAIVVSFYGTGSITISTSNYTYVLQGTGVNQRVYHVINNSKGSTSFTFTVSGQVYGAQCETVGANEGVLAPTTTEDSEYDYVVPTSWIPTPTSTPVTREADVLSGYGIIYTDFNELNDQYNPSSTYSLGDRVLYENYIYESLADSNTGNTPSSDSNFWLLVQTGNKFAMFDLNANVKSESTTGTSGAIVGIRIPGGLADSCTLLELSAVSDYMDDSTDGDSYDVITTEVVTCNSNRDGGPKYTFNTNGYIDGSIYTSDNSRYFHVDDIEADIISFRLISPESYDGEFYYVIDENTVLNIGEIIIGESVEIGDTDYGLRAGIVDYSIKDTDSFGNTNFVKRGYSKRMNANVTIDNTDVNRVLRTLYELRATPTVFVATDDYYEASLIYGYYRDFTLTIAYPEHSLYSLEVEGLAI